MLKLWRFRWRFQEILWRILALFDFNFGAVAEKNLATLKINANRCQLLVATLASCKLQYVFAQELQACKTQKSKLWCRRSRSRKVFKKVFKAEESAIKTKS